MQRVLMVLLLMVLMGSAIAENTNFCSAITLENCSLTTVFKSDGTQKVSNQKCRLSLMAIG